MNMPETKTSYIASIRYARFENGQRVEYLPGSEIQLSAAEVEKFAAGTLRAVDRTHENPEVISIPAFSKQLREHREQKDSNRKESAQLRVADADKLEKAE